MYTYCLYCEAGKSIYVAAELMAQLNCQAVIPKQVQHTFSKGKWTNRVHNLLPGYLFIYAEEPIEMFTCKMTPGVVRCLKSNEAQYELQGRDQDFALYLYEKKGIIGKTQVIERDGRLEIIPISFHRADVSIARVDRRNRRMKINIRFLRQTFSTWIEYEIVKQEPSNEQEPQ